MRFWNTRDRPTAALLAILMIGCQEGERNGGQVANPATDSASLSTAFPSANGERAEAGVVLFMGTSLTAGLGLPIEQSFPMVIDARLAEAGLPYRAVNAGVSGETSAGALRRIDWVLEQPFDILVLETGANDMLRGTSPDDLEKNIQAIIDRVREEMPESRIILAGMRAAPNLGQRYVAEFESIYPRLAERNDVALIPFLLEGVAANEALNQGDGLHPNAAGQRIVADHVWKVLLPVVTEAGVR